MPVSHSARMPPIRENGMLAMMTSALANDLNASKSKRKMIRMEIGTMMARRFMARSWFSNSAAQGAEGGELGERHVGAGRRRNEQLLHARELALLLLQTHGDREAALAFPHLRHRLAAERALDHVLHVADVDAVARGARPVDAHLDLRQLAQAIDEAARHARHGLHLLQYRDRQVAQRLEVLAEHLDHDLAVDLRDRLEDVVADR